jgi:hypothetical protein
LIAKAEKGPDSDILKKAFEDADNDPVALYKMLSVGEEGVPLELNDAWEAVRAKRTRGKSLRLAPPPAQTQVATRDADKEDGDRNLLTGDWWTDNYCTIFAIYQDSCECYKYITGDYRHWVYGDDAFAFAYPYRGSVRLSVKEWTDSEWNQLATTWVYEGEVGWATAVGPYNYYGGFVTSATGDGYHWSMHTVDDVGCKANTDYCRGVCQEQNF